MADTQAFENLQRYGLCFGEEDEFIDKLDNGDYLKRADVLALASRPAEVDDWIKLSEQEPEVGETVLVFSEIWGSSRVLRFRVQPWKSFLDADQGRWFWNLETMLWKRFSAPSHTTNKEK